MEIHVSVVDGRAAHDDYLSLVGRLPHPPLYLPDQVQSHARLVPQPP